MDTKTIFLHIPKAGGSTLHRIAEHQYVPKKIFTVKGDAINKYLSKLNNLSKKEVDNLQFIKGNLPFGIHRTLPGKYQYITILRDPVRRVISHYYYVKQSTTHYLHQKYDLKNMSLKEYVSNPPTNELNNGQVRFLCGLPKVDYGLGGRDYIGEEQKMLDAAKENLRNMPAFGLLERYDLSLLLFADILNWHSPYYKIRNKAKVKKEKVSDETLEIIKANNQADIKLYRFAEEIFRKKTASFSTEDIQKFKRINRLKSTRFQLLFKDVVYHLRKNMRI
ncbi:MAG: sulfotransferase family 2 domain-containing protein [Bacteroidota bacterium]|nr:sulfotransferase family 2 domain-containing protein [Bacteroidota bacterium]